MISVILYLLEAAGFWGLLKKCGEKGWWGLIPGVRFARLGKALGLERDGKSCLAAELLYYIMRAVVWPLPETSSVTYWLSLVVVILLILLVIFEIRFYFGFVREFGLRRIWIVFAALFGWIALPILGFRQKYQPVGKEKRAEVEDLAGATPTEHAAAVDNEEGVNGLQIHVREKTAKKNGKVRYLLKDINLSVPDGSLVLLLGGSGAGKTTLVNAITGYEKVDANIRLHGVDVYKNYDDMKYRIGLAPQQDLLRMNDSVMSTLQDAALLRLPSSLTQEERNERVSYVVRALGLEGRAEGLVAQKSGGQKKRISIGTELISDPELFILDEPDSGLDGVIARELFERLRALADEGRIVMAITHTPDRVVDLFDRIIVLARDSGKVGRLAFYGTPDEAREFFGKSSMEQIVMAINRKEEGGEGRADEFIEKYAACTRKEGEAGDGR